MINNKVRKGLRSIWWNPEFVQGALRDKFDIPFCPTTAKEPPKAILTWVEAKKLFLAKKRGGDNHFKDDSFVCFYCDDYKFDTFRGIWFSPKKAIEVLKHFKGIITPDFSTHEDFPFSLRVWNTYRMRAFGYYATSLGIEVINNVRGRTEEDFSYCFNGIETNSIVAVGTVGSGLKFIENRPGFEMWLNAMVERLCPKTIIVYGSSNYACFDSLRKAGIKVLEYESSTSKRWRTRQ